MISLVYDVSLENTDAEKEWLKELKIYPSTVHVWDAGLGKVVTKFGVIVSPDAAVFIKLRHPLQLQQHWKQR